MDGLLFLYLKLYLLALLPFVLLVFVLLFVPMTRIAKAVSVSIAGVFILTPVVVPVGWGAVFAPVIWDLMSGFPRTSILLMQFQVLESATLHVLSLLSTFGLCLSIGYYLIPKIPLNRIAGGP